MHSFTDRFKPFPRRALWALAAVILAGAATWLFAGPTRPATQHLVASVARGSIENTVLSAGVLQPLEYVDVGAQTSGQLKSLKVKLGDKVAKGQLLAEIDPVVSAAKVVEAEATLKNLEEQLRLNQEQSILAGQQHQRSQELLQQDALAAADAEIAASNYKVAGARVGALRAQIRQAMAALQTAHANLGYTRITAPLAGEVVSIGAHEGQTLNASQQTPNILRIANLDTMTVWTQVSEADVARLKLGQEAYFTVLGEPERRWHGKLRQILPAPEIINNVVFYNALFDVPNPEGELKIQMTAQVFFVLEEADNALIVPVSALARDDKPGRSNVRVLKEDGSTETRSVRVGVKNAVAAQIIAGLTEGETVVTGGDEARGTKKEDNRSAPVQKAKSK